MAEPSQLLNTPKKTPRTAFSKVMLWVFGILGTLWLIGFIAPDRPAQALTTEHQEAVRRQLNAKALSMPTSIAIRDDGFVVADYQLSNEEIDRVQSPLKAFAQMRLLAIREAMLPFGFKNYRVNLYGPPPGTGLVKRYGSARLIDGGSVEWLTTE